MKDDRLKEALPVLYDSVICHLSEELKYKSLVGNVCGFKLLLDKEEVRTKGFAIAYTIAMYKIGRRAEQSRRDQEQLKSYYKK